MIRLPPSAVCLVAGMPVLVPEFTARAKACTSIMQDGLRACEPTSWLIRIPATAR